MSETPGVRVWPVNTTLFHAWPTWANDQPHRVIPEAEAAALVDVAEAARELLDCDPMSDRFHDRLLVLRKLDAARAAK